MLTQTSNYSILQIIYTISLTYNFPFPCAKANPFMIFFINTIFLSIRIKQQYNMMTKASVHNMQTTLSKIVRLIVPASNCM